MKNIHSTYIRALSLVTCVSVVSLLAACGPTSDGYYDTNGNWIATNTTHKPHAPLPGGTNNDFAERDNFGHTNNVNYSRRGYYDYNGYYIPNDSGLTVPQSMFPPRGMCRVWMMDRKASDQPAVESCDGIKSRVPAGAYVIYGG